MKILIIPGASDNLNLVDEIFKITNAAAAFGNISVETILPRDANKERILQRIAYTQGGYEGIHFLGHAGPEFFQLPDSTILKRDDIRQICRDSGAHFVFLNACSTGALGQYLVNEGVAVCIAHESAVNDAVAINYAMRFYTQAARHRDILRHGLRAAYKIIEPGDGTLYWFGGDQIFEDLLEPINEKISLLGATMTDLTDIVRELRLGISTAFTAGRVVAIAIIVGIILLAAIMIVRAESPGSLSENNMNTTIQLVDLF